MPTFYKAFEGILAGDKKTSLSDVATSAENYMAKFNQISVSDKAQESFFNYEQIVQMTGDIFSQIYEQRAAANLSKLFYKTNNPEYLTKLAGKAEVEVQKAIMSGAITDASVETLELGYATITKTLLTSIATRRLPISRRLLPS